MSRQKPDLPHSRSPCNLPNPESTHSFWHSRPSPLLTAHRSTRNLPNCADVVVIGSGMTGTSVAHHLLADPTGTEQSDGRGNTSEGLDVVMLEAREACWGATGRNGGHCQPLLLEHPHDPSIARFEVANYHALDELVRSKDISTAEFFTQHGVRAIYDQHNLTDSELRLATLQQTAPEMAAMVRITTSQHDLDELRIPTAVGAVVTSIAARMWPYQLVARVLEDLLTSQDLRGSFNLQTHTAVNSIEAIGKGRSWIVHTSRGDIEAGSVVLATNAYTSHLLPKFADLIVPCRGQMSALQPLPFVAGENRLTTSFGFLGDGIDDYLVQRPNEKGGHLMFGGGRQHGPSIGVTDDSVIDKDTARYLRTRLVEALGPLSSESERVEADKSHIEFNATYEWSGIMGFSRDDLPWVGAVPEHRNLYIAAGFTGHGMPNCWLSGKAVAAMVQSVEAMDQSGAMDRCDSLAEVDPCGIDGATHAPSRVKLCKEAAMAVGLPKAYLPSMTRMARALEMEDVEMKDWLEMERGRAAREGGRPPSGYA